MARGVGDFPTFELPRGESPDLARVDRSAPAAGALGQLGADADRLGGQLQEMAVTAARQRGSDEAARDVTAGAVTPRQDGSVAGQAYDTVAKNYLGSQRQAAIAEQMQTAFEANPQNPANLGPALDAVHQAFTKAPTPYGDLNVELDGHYLVRRADFMARAIAGQKAASVAQDKANFTTEVSTGADLLDQTAAGASADAGGGARITDAASLFMQGLAKYGPKEAFDVGGQHFEADPNRRAAVTPEEMAKISTVAISKARSTWILSTAQTLPDEMSRKAFAAQVMEKWKAGDPAFGGIDGPEMERLQDKLHASADRARADDRASKAEYEQSVHHDLEAFGWGADVDLNDTLARARLSGNTALVAQADFYAHADRETRGVLRTVVARQLGLVGAGGPGAVAVDANGVPVANDPAAVASHIGADPGAFFSKLVGAPVTITSGQRSAAHNAAVGGSPTSEHLTGKAWDIVVPGMTSAEVFAKLSAAGVPHDQLIDEHDHVHFGLGPAMRNQALVKGEGGAWTTPPDVQAGTPAYMAWASAAEGFSTDPLKYARGGQNRAAIANVPVLVPLGAYEPGAPGQAWSQAFAKRWSMGQSLARSYGVPVRTLTNGERDFYKQEIDADPMKGIALAGRARDAAGPDAALRVMREIGETDFEASASLHIADLAAGGSVQFARTAAQGLQLQATGKAHLEDQDRQQITTAFDRVRGSAPTPVLTAAFATAQAAMIQDKLAGVQRSADFYVNSALGAGAQGGRLYGGPVRLNGATTVLPRWLGQDHADDALQAIGASWAKSGVGPLWANGTPATGDQIGRMQIVLQPSGGYRFINPRTGNPLMAQGGRPFEADLDKAKAFVARAVGAGAVRPGS